MATTIKDVFDEVARHVVVDVKLLKRIHEYERAFVNRNEDHIAFFGGNLTGVHPMRFRPIDRDNWFNDVLDIDEIELHDQLASLESISAEWKRASDAMNHSCIWLLYAILSSKHLSPAQKEKGAVDVMLVLQYKFLGSLMAHYFPYPADEATMLAVYAQLSRKYAIKNAGSWSALLQKRAEEMLQPRSIHHKTYTTLGPDSAINYMISDIQGRLREIIKSIWAVFANVRKEGVKIGTERSMMDTDEGMVLKDRTRQYSTFLRYAHDIIGDRPSWIRAELINVVSDAMHTMPPKGLVDTLEWMSLNHRVRGGDEVEKLIDETLLHAFELIAADRDLMGTRQGLAPLITKLRSLYMASRMSDPTLLKTKELADKIVTKAIASKNTSVIASVRTGVQLYIVLRVLTMKHYQG